MEKKWNMVPLGECAEIIMGQSPNGESYNNQGIGVPLINGPADYGQIHPEPKQWTTQATKMCLPRDIIFCVRASVGKLNLANDSCCIGRGVAAIRGKENVSLTEYLMHILAFHEDEFVRISKGAGTTFPNLTSKELAKHLISLPPLSEQNRIASTLSAVDKAIEQANIAIEERKRMKRGLIQKLIDECNQKTLIDGTINHVFTIVSGTTPSTSVPEYWENGTVIWVTPADLSNVNEHHYIGSSERLISEIALKKTGVNLVPKNTIIMSTRAPVGTLALAKESLTFNQGCHGLVNKDEFQFYTMFYYFYLLSKQAELQNQSGGSTFKELSMKRLRDFPVPIIPLPEQKRIADVLSTVDKAIELSMEHSKKLNRIKRGIMQQLLSGVNQS